jgi:hypothetical protein
LTTPEAFGLWLVLTVATVLALIGIGEVFDVVFPQFVMSAAIWLPLLLVYLTPKKRSRERR